MPFFVIFLSLGKIYKAHHFKEVKFIFGLRLQFTSSSLHGRAMAEGQKKAAHLMGGRMQKDQERDRRARIFQNNGPRVPSSQPGLLHISALKHAVGKVLFLRQSFWRRTALYCLSSVYLGCPWPNAVLGTTWSQSLKSKGAGGQLRSVQSPGHHQQMHPSHKGQVQSMHLEDKSRGALLTTILVRKHTGVRTPGDKTGELA